MTMTTYDLSYWVNDGATVSSDRQEWRNRFRGESQEFVLSTLILWLTFMTIIYPSGDINKLNGYVGLELGGGIGAKDN